MTEPPTIGHLKSGFRLARIFIRNVIGDHISVLMAAAAKSFAYCLPAFEESHGDDSTIAMKSFFRIN